MPQHVPPSLRLRLLEVAAMPFPSHQGTQALLREQCETLAARGHEVHLLVYAHGAFPYDPPFTVHRLEDWPRERALRSGPSWRKAILDARLVAAVRRLTRELRPDLVHAHNYEALAACLAARLDRPLVYHAHTLFGLELPTFARSRAARLAARAAGAVADRALPGRATLTLAVSPRLVAELVARGHPPERIECSLPGITLPAVALDHEGPRVELGLEDAQILAYCGNLDRYQGISTLLEAVAVLASSRPALKLLVITASASDDLERAAASLGIRDRLRVVRHGGFSEALRLLAAADVAVVPRALSGGLPIKLLAYLAAACPVVTTRAGTAGLALEGILSVVPDGEARAMAAAVEWLLDRPASALSRGRAGRALVERAFSWSQAGERLERQLLDALRRAAD